MQHCAQHQHMLLHAAPAASRPCRLAALRSLAGSQPRSTGNSKVMSQAGAVISPLVGKQVLQLSPYLSTVPLLDPMEHSLPFSAALQIYSSRDNDAWEDCSRSRRSASPSIEQDTHHGPLVALHYVISGTGHYSDASSEGHRSLGPGDSFISMHDAAAFAAGPPPAQQSHEDTAAHAQQHSNTQLLDPQGQQQHSTPGWSQLLDWMRHLHPHSRQQPDAAAAAAATTGNPEARHNSVSSHQNSQLVMLQLLLPSELLMGDPVACHAGHYRAVAAQLPWLHSSLATATSSWDESSVCSIREAEVCDLLVSPAHSPADIQQLTQQEHHQLYLNLDTEPGLRASGETTSSSNRSSESGAANGHATEHGHSGDEDGQQHVRITGDSTVGLERLTQQHILKRALSEVGAFRLPQQTNRLALLFGPHSSPAVSCSFGVEVFEPGHRTPLHVHNTAHELFFVLAGRGEAVYSTHRSEEGSSSSAAVQRVQVTPGDVAVFPPGVVHGVDNPSSDQMYCLQMMLPNEAFVEWVRSGEAAGKLDVSAVQRLAAAASCG